MGKPTGFMDYKRQELALRPPQERIKDWEEIKTKRFFSGATSGLDRFCQSGVLNADSRLLSQFFA